MSSVSRSRRFKLVKTSQDVGDEAASFFDINSYVCLCVACNTLMRVYMHVKYVIERRGEKQEVDGRAVGKEC